MDSAAFAFYSSQGPMTSLPAAVSTAELPDDPDGLRRVVQGLLLHRDWAPRYGVSGDDIRLDETQLRSTRQMVSRAREISSQPLAEPRPPIDRVLTCCRHFAVLYTALLRGAGIPARARCGFARYFDAERWVDHWITERLDGARWVRDDPQIDELQVANLADRDFDPHDQPPGAFLTGGEAWLAARAGDIDPESFGIFHLWGLWFIAGNVIRDLASLNNVEVLPWDGWPPMPAPGETIDEAGLDLFDELARLTGSGDLEAIRSRYSTDERLRVPDYTLPPA